MSEARRSDALDPEDFFVTRREGRRPGRLSDAAQVTKKPAGVDVVTRADLA